MKRNYKIVIAVLLLVGIFLGFKKHQNQKSKEQATLFAVHRVLDYAHYQPQKLDDNFSEKVFNEFIQNLDPSKRFLLQADIDSLSEYKYKIDDEINNLHMTLFKKSYAIVLKRQNEVKEYIDEILSKPFRLHVKETMNLDYKHLSYAQTKKELKDRWRKYLKSSVLSKIYDKQKEGETKKKKDSSFVTKNLTDLEEEARKDTKKSMKNFEIAMKDTEEADYFSMFLNAIAKQYDPHTNYFSPESKDNFDTSMSGSFEGIGARLQKDGDYVKITEIIPGGPAEKDGKLKVGDLIIKVGQGDETPVDIIGMRLSNAVKLIKGKKGTVVKLYVKKVDGTRKTIPITRDKVELEETFAKSLIINGEKKKFGYIYLPKFYINFKENKQRSAASDIKKELEKLKNEQVQGIVLDLRNNGGGSLSTAIDIGGFFIDRGPIVQVKDKKNNVDVLNDKDPHVVYSGKLVVLVNELSASASEILAAALQDYNRAIIIGSKTYGKGTVQNIIDLNRVGTNKYGKLGALKWTTKKFYRVTGASTQRKGVIPDIIVPDKYTYLKIREENEKTALKWDKIFPANFRKWNADSFKKKLCFDEQERVAKDSSVFTHIDKLARWIADRKKDYLLYLDFDAYKIDMKKIEKKNKKFDSLIKFETSYSICSLNRDLIEKKNDSAFKSKRKKWIKQLEKDVYLDEAVRVLKKM